MRRAGAPAASRVALTAACGAIALAPAAGIAKETPATSPRPAAAILADYARAIGGAKGWAKHKTMRMRREVEVRGLNLRGVEETRLDARNRAVGRMEIPGMLTVMQGSTGRVRWSQDPINGLRVLRGAEDEDARLESTWAADTRLHKLFRRVRTVPAPIAPPDGATWECVELTPRAGAATIACFDAATHLRVYDQGTRASPQGDTPYTSTFDDWREIDGVRLPFEETVTMGPMTIDVRVVEVAFGEPMPASLFAMPRPGTAP